MTELLWLVPIVLIVLGVLAYRGKLGAKAKAEADTVVIDVESKFPKDKQ